MSYPQNRKQGIKSTGLEPYHFFNGKLTWGLGRRSFDPPKTINQNNDTI